MIKSPNDNRIYDYLILDNKLKVILIQDITTINSYACLNINIGSLYDNYVPYKKELIKVEGIAHFLEHMLFLGSKKYPEEDIYMDTVSKYSGSSNAYTTLNNTCYYFNTSNDGFKETLDIFAQFFIHPLFNLKSVMREMQAVNSEHQKNINNDELREHQILKACMKKNNPVHGFSTGNLQTLNIPNILDKLKSFYNTYYSSDIMYLVLLSNINIHELKQYAISMFGHIINKNNTSLIKPNQKVFNTSFYKKIILCKPINNISVLKLIWQIPIKKIIKYINYRPDNFIYFLLGHEDKGSICNLLKSKNLILNINIYDSCEIYDMSLIEMRLELTNKGLNNINHIMQIIEEYFKMLINNITNKSDTIIQIYDELYQMSQYNFNYAIKSNNENHILGICEKLTKYEQFGTSINQVLYCSKLKKNINIEKFCAMLLVILNYINIEKAIMLIRTNDPSNELGIDEPLYNNKYTIVNKMSYYGDIAKDININKDIAKLYLPSKNKYISNKLVIYTNINTYDKPILIKNIKHMELWYQFCNTFNRPDLVFLMEFDISNIKTKIKEYLVFCLYISCLLEILNIELCNMAIAQYDCNIYITNIGFNISINGPYIKIKNISELFINSLLNLKINKDIFEKMKLSYIEKLQNIKYENPHTNLIHILYDNILRNHFNNSDKINTLNNITHEDLNDIKKYMFSKYTIRSFIIGNVMLDDAHVIANTVKRFTKKYKPVNNISFHNNIINMAGHNINKQIENPNETNSAIGLYFKIDYVKSNKKNLDWCKLLCMSNILHIILDTKFMDQLRTSEQLGYIVYSRSFNIGYLFNPLLVYSFVVQSDVKNSQYIFDRIELFIKNGINILENENITSFNKIKKYLIDAIQKPSENLYELYILNKNKIFYENKIWNLEDIFANTYKEITLEDVIGFYKKYILDTNTRILWTVCLDK
jgi:insulysin